ncbi:phosphate acyltransferase [Sunxiuqinia sp. A32]|uniref:phosphate acyltransferase n=1 Tax=Sunxiuqinia sp. A32 TaxID=3461496 RepID=UPI004045B041
MRIERLSQLFDLIKKQPAKRMVIVNAIDNHSIEAAKMASDMGLVKVILTGNTELIKKICSKLNVDDTIFDLVDSTSEDHAALIAVKMIKEGKADFLMKGLINTDKYMRAVLNKESGLTPKGNVLSHVTVIENENYHKLLIVSDVAVIPYPTLDQKVLLCKYLIQTAKLLGIETPKVALIAPTEQVLPAIPACVDAEQLVKMAEADKIKGGVLAGPMALDVAIDKESAEIKKIDSPVAGDADCLLFPNIDAGNVFYKMNTKLCHAKQAAVVVGAKVPVVLSSRGDSSQTKLNSIALAALLSK